MFLHLGFINTAVLTHFIKNLGFYLKTSEIDQRGSLLVSMFGRNSQCLSGLLDYKYIYYNILYIYIYMYIFD